MEEALVRFVGATLLALPALFVIGLATTTTIIGIQAALTEQPQESTPWYGHLIYYYGWTMLTIGGLASVVVVLLSLRYILPL